MRKFLIKIVEKLDDHEVEKKTTKFLKIVELLKKMSKNCVKM